jgi:hypothetical protein
MFHDTFYLLRILSSACLQTSSSSVASLFTSMDQLLEHQLSSLSSSPSSSSSPLISFQFLSFFYDEYDVTDTKKTPKASLETLFSSQLQKYLSLSNNTILSSSSSPFSAISTTSSELHYSILLLLSTSVKLGGILHGISSLYSSSYSSLYQLVVVYFFLLPPPSIPSLTSSSASSTDIAKKECFLLSHSILRELLIQQEYPIKAANQQLQYQIISFLCSESERFLSLQQEEILLSNRKVFSSSVNVFLNELLQTMILIATNTLYSSSSSSATSSDGGSTAAACVSSLLPSLVSLILRILSLSSSSASSAAAKKRLLLSFDFWFELEGLSPEEREEDLSLSNSFFFQLFQLLFVHIQYPSSSRGLTREGGEGEEGEEENEELLQELRDLELGINDLFPFCFSCCFSDCFSFLFKQFQQVQQQQQSLSSLEGILFCFFCCSKVIKDHLLLSSSDGSMVTAAGSAAVAAVSKSKNDILRFLLLLSNACFQIVTSFSSVSASSSSLKHQFSRCFCLFLGSLTAIYCSSFNDDSSDTKRFPFPLETDLLQQLKDNYLTTLKYCLSLVFSSHPSDSSSGSSSASVLISSSTSSLPLLAAKTIQRLLTHCSLLKKENERVTLSNILSLFFSLFNPSSSLSLSSLTGSPDKVMATSMILEGFAILCYEIRENCTLSFLLVELSQPFLQALQPLLPSLSVTSSTASSKELHNRLKMLVLSCQQIIVAKMKISAGDAELNEKGNTFLRWLLREIWAILSSLFTFCLPSMDSSATSTGSFGLSLVFSTYSQFILTLSLLQIPKEIQITMIQNASSVISSPFTDLLSLKSILLFLPDFVDSYYVNQVQLEEQEVLGDRLMMITGDISQKLVSASSSSSDLSQQVGRILEMEGGMEVFSAYFQLLLLHLQRNRSGFLALVFLFLFRLQRLLLFFLLPLLSSNIP